MNRSFLCLALALFGALALPADLAALGRARDLHQVGVRSLSVITPDKAPWGVLVWYPSSREEQAEYSAGIGLWEVHAEKNVEAVHFPCPVILLSHDMVSHNLANHDLASALAERGFIVIVPTHAGDSQENAGALYTAALLYYRPRQLLEALKAVTAEPAFAGRLDLERVGILGIGAGSLTALQLCGVDIDPAAYAAYCASVERDEALCPAWAGERLRLLPVEVREIRGRHGAGAFAPAPPKVRAVGLLTPGWLPLAGKSALEALGVPLAALFAGEDGLYPGASGGLFPPPFDGPAGEQRFYRLLPEADHYSLAAACPQALRDELAGLCGGIQGEARKNLAGQRDAFFVSFFRRYLSNP
jgi:predicted dienelactone hydrolase